MEETVVTASDVGCLVMACILMALTIRWLFKKDDKLEEIRKALYELGHILNLLGFEFLDDVVRDLAAGDLSGAVRSLKQIMNLAKDKVKFMNHMRDVYAKGVVQLMDDDPAFCERIARVVNDKKTLEDQEAATKADQAAALAMFEKSKAEEAAEIAEARKLVAANKAKAA